MQPVPSWIISLLFLLSAVLCVYSAWKYSDWTGRLFAPVLTVFAVLYYYYTIADVDIVVRQIQVRWGLVIVGLTILLWRITTLWLQRAGKR